MKYLTQLWSKGNEGIYKSSFKYSFHFHPNLNSYGDSDQHTLGILKKV